MSGLEIAAATIGIADVTVKSILAFYDYCKSLHNAPSEVTRARDEIKAVLDCANGLTFLEHGSPGLKNKVKEVGLKESIEGCGKACREFEAQIVRWTEGGVDKILSKMKVVRHKDRFETYMTAIASTKSNITLAVGVANLYILTEERSASEAEKNAATQSLKADIERLMDEAKNKRDETERLRQELEMQYSADDSSDTEAQLKDAQERIATYERLALDCSVAAAMIKELAAIEVHVGNVTAGGDDSSNRVGVSKDIVDKVRSARVNVGDVGASGARGTNEIGIF